MARKLRFFLLGFVLMSLPHLINAQSKGFTGGFNTNISTFSDEFKSFEFKVNLGYYIFPDFFAAFNFEESVGLFNLDNTKRYVINETFGGLLGYNIYRFEAGVIDVKAGVGTSINSKDWKFTYYDGTVSLNIGKSSFRPSIGLGVRYYDSRNSLYKNYFNFFVTFGFKFN